MEWQEARSGARVYWYNTITKQSTWDKPQVLKTPFEKAIDQTPWKEYADANGRKYYVHNDTKETTWEQPEEVKTALAAVQAAMPPAVLPPSSAPAASVASAPGGGALIVGGTGMSIVPPMPGEGPKEPSLWFNNPEEAKRAFVDVLRSAGVRENWTWEQTMRHIITAPMYRALPTNEERRAAFEQYVAELRKRDQERKQQALERIRPAWREGLGRAIEKGGGGMKSWWSWERAKALLQERYEDMWDSARDDSERRTLWEEYVGDLRKKEKAREDEMRSQNLAKLKKLFDAYDIGLDHSWAQTRRIIERSKEWQADQDLQQVAPIDFLAHFEDHFKALELQEQSVKQKQRDEKRRRIRKNREGFVALLQDLKAAGTIKHNTNWATIYPLIKDGERYQNILGNPGSTPLELFWDIVDEMDQRVEEQCRVIEGVLAEKRKTVNINTTWEEFATMLENDGIPQTRVKDIDEVGRRNVHGMLHDRYVRLAREEKRRQEKKIRGQIDDLRHALRKVEPEIGPEATYEETLAAISELPEFKALTEDEHRKTAFDKHIQRAKERKAIRDAEEAEAQRRRERAASHKAVSERGMSEDARSVPGSPRKDRHGSRGLKGDEMDVDPPERSRHRKRSPSRERDRHTRRRHEDDRSRRHRRSRSRETKRSRHESPNWGGSRGSARSPAKVDPADEVNYGSPPPEQKAKSVAPMDVDPKPAPAANGEEVEEGEVA